MWLHGQHQHIVPKSMVSKIGPVTMVNIREAIRVRVTGLHTLGCEELRGSCWFSVMIAEVVIVR
jgi:type 1 glutamine amidotransferase